MYMYLHVFLKINEVAKCVFLMLHLWLSLFLYLAFLHCLVGGRGLLLEDEGGTVVRREPLKEVL